MAELGGTPEATVIGLEERLPAPNAAFANAMLCHGLDFDDTHGESVAHVSTVVSPAAMALAEARGAAGADLLAAIVAGNEIVTRVGMAAPGAFHARGFHPTAICGIFGAPRNPLRRRLRLLPPLSGPVGVRIVPNHSHSIVPGGFEVTS